MISDGAAGDPHVGHKEGSKEEATWGGERDGRSGAEKALGDGVKVETDLTLKLFWLLLIKRGPHVETISLETLPDNIIHRLGRVSQTHSHTGFSQSAKASVELSSPPKKKKRYYSRNSGNQAPQEIVILTAPISGLWFNVFVYKKCPLWKRTFINCTIPSGTDVLLSFCRYSTMSEVCSPTLTAAYRE